MGKLAKIGIYGGQKAPVQNVLRENGVTWFDGISILTLKEFGLETIAESLSKGEGLSLDQINTLLVDTPLPALFMLVETVRLEETMSSPTPIVSIPGMQWLDELGFAGALKETSSILESMDFNEDFLIYIEDIDILRLDKLAPFFDALRDIFIGVSFAAPGLGQIGQQLTPLAVKSAKGFEEQLREILELARKVGFDRLRGSRDRASLKLVGQAGFPVSVCTLVDCYPDRLLLAKELFTLNQYAEEGKIHAWFPGLKSISDGAEPSVDTDFTLLRTLAVGSIVLRNIPFYRATSAFFTLEGVRTSFMFGANDFGYGAFNEGAEQVLNLQPFDRLNEAFDDSETGS